MPNPTSETYAPDNLLYGDFPVTTEDVVIQSGQNLKRGSVLGIEKATVPATGTADGGNTGDGTCTAVTGGKDVQIGTYTLECVRAVTNGGEFRLIDPNGAFVGDVLITAGAGGTGILKTDQINATVTDGATDFAVGDKFTIAVTSGVPATGTADGGNTGNGTMTQVEGRRDTKEGTYTITCTAAATNAGTFSVVDPDGNTLPSAEVGTVYENDQLSFLLNDGSTDFIVGDIFTVAVTRGTKACKLCNSANTDGSQNAKYVLLEDADATSADVAAIAAKSGNFNERSLIFGGTDTIDDHKEEMRALGLYTNASSVPESR